MGDHAAAADLARQMADREAHNADNRTRTAFYLAYWRAHPEVTWALLGHLVSRNVGYQMTDLRRHLERCRRGGRWLSRLDARLVPAAQVEHALGQLVRFLEAGNYLIFHDVYTQLAAYAAAKRAFLATRDAGAGQVFDGLDAKGVDATILPVWKRFFDEGAGCGFFQDMSDTERRSAPAVVRMALASVVNEQCLLEDRLLAPAGEAPRYVDAEVAFSLWFDVAAALGLTRLVFAVAAPGAPERAGRLLVHVLGGRGEDARRGPWWATRPLFAGPPPPSFRSLGTRIDVGRRLYFGLFMADPGRAAGIERWALGGPAHTGERSAYDPYGYAPTARRSGLLSRPLPSGPLPDWPGAPGAALPTWSTRITRRVQDVEPIRADPFALPAGWDVPVEPGRPLVEVVDPVWTLLRRAARPGGWSPDPI